MKLIFTILGMIWVFTAGLQAQQPRDGERLEALKIAYLTKKLNLTTEEAQRFWPVYNQYMADLKKVRADERNGNEIEKDEKILAVRKKYQADFSKALSPERANDFFRAEKEFYGFVAKELQQRRQLRQEAKPKTRDFRR
ncbi:hypothetical protein [Flavihumibacter fluvii]|uniref:hypothetical protein n=1 Tax=Flavihumibacter fluvii TaxID=2838157 RepID=UPI001BDF6CE9|nr:hypothetical protein [Flavihumibacter fluvii]ULQ52491.1 hypothetical protein KJS93_20595 [Flavihumibacter fluvii]